MVENSASPLGWGTKYRLLGSGSSLGGPYDSFRFPVMRQGAANEGKSNLHKHLRAAT